MNTSLSYPLPSLVRSNGYRITHSPTILVDLHRRSIPRDPMDIASSAHQLARMISTIDVTHPIERLSCNLVQILAWTISDQGHMRKVVFSCYVSPAKVNRMKFRNTIYHFISTCEILLTTYEYYSSILLTCGIIWSLHFLTLFCMT